MSKYLCYVRFDYQSLSNKKINRGSSVINLHLHCKRPNHIIESFPLGYVVSW